MSATETTTRQFAIGDRVVAEGRTFYSVGAFRYYHEAISISLDGKAGVVTEPEDIDGDIRVRFDYGSRHWISPECLRLEDLAPLSTDVQAGPDAAPVRDFQVGDKVIVVEEPYFAPWAEGTRMYYRDTMTKSIELGSVYEVKRYADGREHEIILAAGPGGLIGYRVARECVTLLGPESDESDESDESTIEAPKTPESDQSSEIARLTLRATSAEAALAGFRAKVRDAVIAEAEKQGWCDRTDEWLTELGLEPRVTDAGDNYGLPIYRNSVVRLRNGNIAILADDDSMPWNIRDQNGEHLIWSNFRDIGRAGDFTTIYISDGDEVKPWNE